ncbi:MAG TPA: hypothetical protein VKR59_00515 [Terriglobales bacterium]|nr:hypothetical protein [Terriglobales bacterium]
MKQLLFVILVSLTAVAQQSSDTPAPDTPAPASSPAAQQAPTTKDSATPTTETSSPSAIPAGASSGIACDLPKDLNDGFVIISATLPPYEHHPGFPLSIRYTYKAKGGGWLKNKSLDISRAQHVFHKAESDFDGVFGELYVLRLPAGDYEFSGWEDKPLGMNGTERPAGIHPLTFAVAGGRAVYLGGFDPSLSEGKNLLHQKVDSTWVLVHDDQSRDLPVFFNKCPGFDRNLLDVKVMDTAPWLPQKKN